MRLSLLATASCATLLALAAPGLTSAQSFTSISTSLTDVHHGSSLWGDYDDDGDLDALITGEQPSLTAFAEIYENDPLGTFTSIGSGISGITGTSGMSRSAWGDYNNDGLLDVIVTGPAGFPLAATTTLYRNTGSGFAQETVSPALAGITLGSAAWGDYDNDGDLDLFACGYYNGGSGLHITTVYRNDGPSGSGWAFTDINPFAGIPGSRRGWSDGAWGDYDNDGDLDLVTIGYRVLGADPLTQLYRNDGGVFVLSSVNNLVNVGMGSVTWGDVNSDGWLDLVITGSESLGGPTAHFKVYTNNQNGTFTQSASLYSLANSHAAVGDYNNDGKLDLVAIGLNGNYPVALAYLGNGNGTFTQDNNSGLTDVYEGQVSFGDYDNDGRLDLIITGRDNGFGTHIHTKVYHNTTGASANTAPNVPTGLTATAVTWNSITVQWNLSSDAESGNHLSYNLKVEDLTASTTVEVPMANAATGYRHVPALGNANLDTKWTIGGLTSGHQYRVCVQAIDQAYAASAFNCGVTVTTTSDRPDVMIGDCDPGDVGTEPNTACPIYFNSPNIWARASQDGTLPGNDWSQYLNIGGTNFVYARVKNIGAALMTHGRVYFYFAKAATVFNWPQHWSGYYNGSTLEGDLIGYADVDNLSGGATAIVWTTWNNTPNFEHVCILTRFVAASDPMYATEVINSQLNSQNNNNIAWRNIWPIGSGGGGGHIFKGPVGVYNGDLNPKSIGLHFGVPGEELEDNVLSHTQIKFIMGDQLADAWHRGGSQTSGTTPVEGDPNAFWITSTDARFDNIQLEGSQQAYPELEVTFKGGADVAGHKYHLSLAQFNMGEDAPDGGGVFEIEMPDAGGKRAVTPGSIGGVLGLMARPNPTSNSTTIGYTLPTDSRVSVALYDAGGRLVRTLVAGTEQKMGRHEIEWDGTSADGAPVPSGTYFYSIETSHGAARGQVRIVR